jgi:catechol 2,3-dioxygenase-like lactoylglutathione lyase family enzyme
MIRGVKFVSIPVTDQDRALAFYTDVLGFRLLTDQPSAKSSAGWNSAFREPTRGSFYFNLATISRPADS